MGSSKLVSGRGRGWQQRTAGWTVSRGVFGEYVCWDLLPRVGGQQL